MGDLPLDDYAFGSEARQARVLKDLCFRQWQSAAEALLKAIPLCANLSSEDALRTMAKMFRETAENIK